MLRRTGTIASARFALTDRHGGVSRAPYDALDLGDHVGDDPAAVGENRRLLALRLGLDPAGLVLMQQVHGTDVAVVEQAPGPGEAPPVADALVTTRRGLALVVLVADCVPVLLAAGGSDVVAVAHAGRRGVAAGVVGATVAAMGDLGARPDRVVAVVGPAICGDCYELPAEMADEVAAVTPAARSTTRSGTPGLDLRAGVAAQLAAAGVETIEVDARCTAESPELYSHRRDGVTGRFAGVVVR
ncbi:MAG: peptidoglycan editing factor PgeF [Sporichthyaceae bacterium]